MKIATLMILAGSFATWPVFSANAQVISGGRFGVPSPPPPSESREAAGNHFRFNASRGAETNAQTRKLILQKLAEWQRRLNELDRKQATTIESMPPQTETRNTIVENMKAWQHKLTDFQLESICGPMDRSQEVEFYDGRLGPSREFVGALQLSTAQIQWNNDLPRIFNNPGDDPGNVNDVRWCTGTLISERMFLTAGHCFDINSNDWRTPRKREGGIIKPLSPEQLAPLMHVNFNYQRDRATKQIRKPTVFPITKLWEHREGNLDFAVVELGSGHDGQLPGKQYPVASMDSSASVLQKASLLTIIQHPNGVPKRIAAGSKINTTDTIVAYGDIDTLGGSSGSGVIDQDGRVIGVHTNGGCTAAGTGTNTGVTLRAISQFSKIVK